MQEVLSPPGNFDRFEAGSLMLLAESCERLTEEFVAIVGPAMDEELDRESFRAAYTANAHRVLREAKSVLWASTVASVVTDDDSAFRIHNTFADTIADANAVAKETIDSDAETSETIAMLDAVARALAEDASIITSGNADVSDIPKGSVGVMLDVGDDGNYPEGDGDERDDVFFQADYYHAKYGLLPDTLLKAHKRKRLHAEKRGSRWYYQFSQVKRLWPDLFITEPDKGGSSRTDPEIPPA
jgi:hypothetical protein